MSKGKFERRAEQLANWGAIDVASYGFMTDGEIFETKDQCAVHIRSAAFRALAQEFRSSDALRQHMLLVQMRGLPVDSHYYKAALELLAAYDAVERNILLQTVKENHGDPASVQAPDRIGAEIPDP